MNKLTTALLLATATISLNAVAERFEAGTGGTFTSGSVESSEYTKLSSCALEIDVYDDDLELRESYAAGKFRVGFAIHADGYTNSSLKVTATDDIVYQSHVDHNQVYDLVAAGTSDTLDNLFTGSGLNYTGLQDGDIPVVALEFVSNAADAMKAGTYRTSLTGELTCQ